MGLYFLTGTILINAPVAKILIDQDGTNCEFVAKGVQMEVRLYICIDL